MVTTRGCDACDGLGVAPDEFADPEEAAADLGPLAEFFERDDSP